MIRVVIDTNVFVSSFFGGKPLEIIKLWSSGKISLCLSQPIVDEYFRVLNKLGLKNQAELEELLKLFSSGQNIIFTATPPKISIIQDDPDDDKFIECAIGLNSKIIISGDRHLTFIRQYLDIKIFNPNDFLTYFNKINS